MGCPSVVAIGTEVDPGGAGFITAGRDWEESGIWRAGGFGAIHTRISGRLLGQRPGLCPICDRRHVVDAATPVNVRMSAEAE